MGSSSKLRACGECSQRCLLAHHDQGTSKNPLSVVPSFFKPLVVESLLTTLVIPPDFAQTIKSLIGQRIDLEDAKGHHWWVELSSDCNQLVFGRGWDQFALDHCLKPGEFLVFYHLMESNFIVKIYSLNGCEKLKFSKKSSGCMRNNSTDDIPIDHMMENRKGSPPIEAPTSTADKIWDNELRSYTSFRSNDNIAQKENNVPTVDKFSMSIENEAPFKGVALISKSVMHNDHKDVPSDSSVDTDSNENLLPNKSNVPTVEKIPFSIENEALFKDRAVISKSVMPNDCEEVPFYLIERDLADVQEANRSCLLDLSDFEMVNAVSGVDKMVQPESKRKADCVENLCNNSSFKKQSADTERACKGARLNSEFESAPKRCHPQIMGTGPLSADKTFLDNRTSSQPEKRCKSTEKVPIVNSRTAIGSSASRPLQTMANTGCYQYATGNPEKLNEISAKSALPEKQKSVFSGMDLVSQVKSNALAGRNGCVPHSAKVMTGCGSDSVMTAINNLSGEQLNVVKDEQFEKSEEIKGSKLGAIKVEPEEVVYCNTKVQQQPSKLVKTENIDSIDFPYFNAEVVSCSAYVVTQSYLELPRNSPTIFGRGRLRMDRKIVVIRDPAMRLWPVIYHEKIGLRVLTTRWEALAMANNIQEGDQCFFEVEDEVENIYRVRIVRK